MATPFESALTHALDTADAGLALAAEIRALVSALPQERPWRLSR